MGKLDAFAKAVFAEETESITGGVCRWEGPREIDIGEHIWPDGFILRANIQNIGDLKAPWSLLTSGTALVELKMPGDHMGPYEWFRALLRRAALDVERSKKQSKKWVNHEPLWFVSPYLPDWIGDQYMITNVERGCYRIGRWPYPVVWIAANELALDNSLVPFLVARSGRPRAAFVEWIVRRRQSAWVFRMAQAYKLPDISTEELLKWFTEFENEEDEQYSIELVRNVIRALSPELEGELDAAVANRTALKRKHLEVLTRMFGLKLERPISEDEREALRQRSAAEGFGALESALIEKTRDELVAWLAQPIEAKPTQ